MRERAFGSHEEVLKDFTPLYLAKRFRAGVSNGVSTSSGNSEGNKKNYKTTQDHVTTKIKTLTETENMKKRF